MGALVLSGGEEMHNENVDKHMPPPTQTDFLHLLDQLFRLQRLEGELSATLTSPFYRKWKKYMEKTYDQETRVPVTSVHTGRVVTLRLKPERDTLDKSINAQNN